MWFIGLGIVLCYFLLSIKIFLSDFVDVVLVVVKVVIVLVLIGIFGLVVDIFVINGLDVFIGYGCLLLVLFGVMVIVVFILNLFIVWWKICCNLYLFIFICLCESGVMVFFICSFVVNIFVNMGLLKCLGLCEEIYLFFILFGVNINMVGVVIIVIVLIFVVVYI